MNDVIRFFNNVFAYTIHNARISTSAGVEIKQNKYVGPISTIMRKVTEESGDLSSYFDIIDESEDGISNSSLKKYSLKNTPKIKEVLLGVNYLSDKVLDFVNHFKKLTKGVRFELDLRASNRKQDILSTTLGDNDVNVSINRISLYIYSFTNPQY